MLIKSVKRPANISFDDSAHQFDWPILQAHWRQTNSTLRFAYDTVRRNHPRCRTNVVECIPSIGISDALLSTKSGLDNSIISPSRRILVKISQQLVLVVQRNACSETEYVVCGDSVVTTYSGKFVTLRGRNLHFRAVRVQPTMPSLQILQSFFFLFSAGRRYFIADGMSLGTMETPIGPLRRIRTTTRFAGFAKSRAYILYLQRCLSSSEFGPGSR